MNFKDKAYYVNKVKTYIGLALTSIVFALILCIGFVFA